LPSFPGLLDGGLHFVEVKSPSDKLQDEQEVWLHILLDMALNAEVWQTNINDGLPPRPIEDKDGQFNTPNQTPNVL